jgi:hypothetical protein
VGCPRWAWEALRFAKLEEARAKEPETLRLIQDALLGGRPCPFISTREWFTMHGSWMYLHHIYKQRFS